MLRTTADTNIIISSLHFPGNPSRILDMAEAREIRLAISESYFDIVCSSCRNEGEGSLWTDDWNRWDQSVTGFNGPLRITGPRAADLRCESCQGSDIEVSHRAQP